MQKRRNVWAVEVGSEGSLTNNRGVSLVHSQYRGFFHCAGLRSKRPRHGRDDCLRVRAGKAVFCICAAFSLHHPVNKMTSKVRAVIQRACDRRRPRRDRHEPPMERTIIPVPQGKRGMLWAWHGRLSQPLSPVGGINGIWV